MKKVWLTALLSLFPAVAGAEVYTLPGVVVTAENRKETKDIVFLPHETLTEKDMERMGASNVVEPFLQHWEWTFPPEARTAGRSWAAISS